MQIKRAALDTGIAALVALVDADAGALQLEEAGKGQAAGAGA